MVPLFYLEMVMGSIPWNWQLGWAGVWDWKKNEGVSLPIESVSVATKKEIKDIRKMIECYNMLPNISLNLKAKLMI